MNSTLSTKRNHSEKREARSESASEGTRRFAVDGGVVLASAALLSIGVVMSYSTTATLNLSEAVPPLFRRHLVALIGGLVCTVATMSVPLPAWRRIAVPLWGVGILLLLLTAFLGIDANGAKRWLDLGVRFQPVEIVKFATLIVVVAVIAPRDGRKDLSDRRAALALGLFTLPPIALLLKQPDLGNAVLIFALVLMLLVVAGRPLRHLLIPSGLAACLVALYVATNDYAQRRVDGFLDPWAQSQTAGFQLVQSFVAFGRGGLGGVGLGNGRQKLDYLFGAHTDFVLSLVAEELGLIGVLVVLGAFAGLLVAGCRIALRSADRFGLLLAFAMTALLTLPALINGAVVMGLVPTKGLTLPFLSYGGTSLVMCCASLGVLLGVARQGGRREAAMNGNSVVAGRVIRSGR